MKSQIKTFVFILLLCNNIVIFLIGAASQFTAFSLETAVTSRAVTEAVLAVSLRKIEDSTQSLPFSGTIEVSGRKAGYMIFYDEANSAVVEVSFSSFLKKHFYYYSLK